MGKLASPVVALYLFVGSASQSMDMGQAHERWQAIAAHIKNNAQISVPLSNEKRYLLNGTFIPKVGPVQLHYVIANHDAFAKDTIVVYPIRQEGMFLVTIDHKNDYLQTGVFKNQEVPSILSGLEQALQITK